MLRFRFKLLIFQDLIGWRLRDIVSIILPEQRRSDNSEGRIQGGRGRDLQGRRPEILKRH